MDAVVLMLGLGLIAVNGSKSGQLTKIWNIFYDKSYTSGNGTSQQITAKLAGAQMDLLAFGGECLLLLFMVTLASKDRSSGKFILMFEVALWVLWTVNNPDYLKVVLDTLAGKRTLNGITRTTGK